MTNFSSLAGMQVAQPQPKVPAPGPSPRLRQAAVEFEANFMQELLKPLTHDSLFSDDSGGDGEIGGSMGTIDSMGTQAVAKALASAGGLGIAKHILAQMAPVEASHAAANPAANTTASPTSPGVQCGGCAAPLAIGAASPNPQVQHAPDIKPYDALRESSAAAAAAAPASGVRGPVSLRPLVR